MMSHLLVAMTDRLLLASWQGGLALGLIWLLCGLLPNLAPRLRCWLWRLAYLKLLLALLGLPAIPLPILPVPSPPTADSGALFGNADPTISVLDSAQVTQTTSAEREFVFTFRLGLLALWGIGFGVISVRTAREWRAGQCLKREGSPEQRTDLLAACREQCRPLGIRHPPALLRSEAIGSPLLLGGIAPAVMLPAALCDTCTSEELRLMLAHELAHLRRQDLWWCWLPTIAQALFWFHPLVWISSREWRVAQEIACDALALEVTQAPVGDYGATLLKVAAQSRALFQPGLAAVSADEFPQILQRRLLAMKNQLVVKRLSRTHLFGLGILLLIFGFIGLVPWRVVAQTGATPAITPEKPITENGITKSVQWIVQQLGLSDNQKVQLKVLAEDVLTRAQSIKSDPTISGEEKKARAEALLQSAEQSVKTILTPAQLQRLLQIGSVQDLLPFSFQAHKITLADVDRELAPNASLLAQVGLTVTQQARLQQIIAASHQQAQAILTNPTLSEEQRMMALKQLRSAAEPQLLATLTPAQRQKLAVIRQANLITAFNRGFDWIAGLIARGELSSAQKARMQQILTTAQNQAAALLANRALAEEQRNVAFKQLYGATQQQMEAVLTPIQQKKLAEIKQSLLR